ncbi:MAG: hypothetical protein K2K41_09825 [Ruminiclostridium sp.]|nr:hypothetical protein [Ruminiclostridium sp.]
MIVIGKMAHYKFFVGSVGHVLRLRVAVVERCFLIVIGKWCFTSFLVGIVKCALKEVRAYFC